MLVSAGAVAPASRPQRPWPSVRSAASDEESLPFYHRAEDMLVEDAPVLFMRYGETVSLVRPWVMNYVESPSDQQNIGDAFYEDVQIAAH